MASKGIVKEYFGRLHQAAARGDASEESFYDCLKGLIQDFASSTGRSAVQVTILPRPTEHGNPDFRVWNGRDRITGYIEAKRPSEERLDYVQNTEQLQRYRSTFPNLILTNFFEFRLYRNGQIVDEVLAARPRILTQVGGVPPVEKRKELLALLDKFLSFSVPPTYTAPSLAGELAKRTRFLRELVGHELRREQAEGEGTLSGFFQAFREFLIGHLDLDQFADLYAQTVTYGLFAARTRAEYAFSRRTAYDTIPRSIGILRDLFQFISLGDLPHQLEWTIDDIAEVLAVADLEAILERYYRDGQGSDPIVQFYEPFLAQYDPQERERRGVYYTPEEVVSYIVRSIHKLLKEKFDRPDGLASEGVTLLDPAAGTMTFVARACQQAVQEFQSKYGAGGTEEFIRDHILKNYYAFELMMAPYAVGHMKMGFFLEELGHRLADDERFQFYLTNTLEMEELGQTQLPGMASLAEESRLAGEVKKEEAILVILGNPPYSGISANKGEWIRQRIEDYKYVDGRHFGEKKHWLQDDYVKFLRFAQWKIDQEGQGIVGMITNHSYLDNPTFRGMRQSLMRTFDEIHVVDLHGNSLKREACPDGSRDENVFDIRQGVVIALFVKDGSRTGDVGTVRHADLWGLRQRKYDWLREHDVGTTDWQEIHPKSEFYLFVPRHELGLEVYGTFRGLTGIFPVYVTGIITARDRFVIDFDEGSLRRKINVFRDPNITETYVKEFLRQLLGRNSVDDVENYRWRVVEARAALQHADNLEDYLTDVLYRPFDVRKIFYHEAVVWRTRSEVMQHMLAGDNVALIVPKQHKGDFGAYVTQGLGTHKTVAAYDINYYFPLHLFPSSGGASQLPGMECAREREANVAPPVGAGLEAAHGTSRTPEALMSYVYAVLYANTYREKYAEFLKTDFPRIPFTADRELFEAMAELGGRLVDLHLLKSDELDTPVAHFEGEGESKVAGTKSKGFRYEPHEERVYVNKTQYFGPVPPELWEYHIGGYQVLEKWLKDRRDRCLSMEEIKTYCRIVTALKRTIEIQEEIDALYPDVEKDIIEF